MELRPCYDLGDRGYAFDVLCILYIYIKSELQLVYVKLNVNITKNGSRASAGLYEPHTVKPVLSGHSKIDKTNFLKTNGSLMKVESIAECCNTFDLL